MLRAQDGPMAFELGFLVGSLLILAAVVYFTRVRNRAVPHAGNVDGDGSGVDRAGSRTQVCDLCERERDCRVDGDLTVCPECDDELLA